MRFDIPIDVLNGEVIHVFVGVDSWKAATRKMKDRVIDACIPELLDQSFGYCMGPVIWLRDADPEEIIHEVSHCTTHIMDFFRIVDGEMRAYLQQFLFTRIFYRLYEVEK